MKKQVFMLCEQCGEPIADNDGVVIQGNMYVVGKDVDARHIIIGNNLQWFTKQELVQILSHYEGSDPAANVITSSVKVAEQAYHKHCLIEILDNELGN